MKSIQRKKPSAVTVGVPSRDPLACGMAVAERFMRIDPPRTTYMYALGLSGLLDLYEVTREQRLLDFVLARTRGTRPVVNFRLFEMTGDKKWVADAREAGDHWLANPRRDRDGALLDPRGRYTIDVVSGLVTVPIVYGHLLQDPRLFDDAWLQFTIARDYLEEPVTGLWFNRWGHGLHLCRPNPGLWGRGNGWLVNALGRVVHLWPLDHPQGKAIRAEWIRYCRAVAGFQASSGLFRQLLNRPESFEDATASGLIGAGLGFSVAHDTLPREMGPASWRAALGLNHLVDEQGNIYNASTTAGGYNFEQQYESCPVFNDPHGDGSVMGACAAVHLLETNKVPFDRTPPTARPVIVTKPLPRVVSYRQPEVPRAVAVAAPVLRRALALADLPDHDPHGSVILGLLHWHDFQRDSAALGHAQLLWDRARDRLAPLDRWRIAGELARRTGRAEQADGLLRYVDGFRAGVGRDRCGVIADEHGGYNVAPLYPLLPLLAGAGTATGQAAYFDEACRQLFGHQAWLEEPNSLFWHSAFGRGQHPRRVTPGFWALGNGYVLAGIVDLLEHLPPTHPHYVDVVCLLRGLVESLHEWLPAIYGWTQLITDYDTFPCLAATGLLTYGCAKAVARRWVAAPYWAAVIGGVYHLGAAIDDQGNYGAASLPTGGLDTLEAYAAHQVENHPSALGFILSGLAYGGICQESGHPYDAEDQRLGAR